VKTILACALFLALLTGTASGGTPDAKKMVLQLQELPTGFAVAVGTGYRSIAAAAKEDTNVSLAQLKAWGYVTGYEADFRASGSPGVLRGGASQIASTVSVYQSASGAERSLASSVAACHVSPYEELSVGAKIGDEAHLCEVTTKSGNVKVQVYAVVWRRGRVKGVVLTAGLLGGASPTQAVKLAEVQDGRMG